MKSFKLLLPMSTVIIISVISLISGRLNDFMMAKWWPRFYVSNSANSLQSLRDYVSIYRGDKEMWPESLDQAAARYAEISKKSKGIPSTPDIYSSQGLVHQRSKATKWFLTFAPDDTGGWGYIRNPLDPENGRVFINCTHEYAYQGTKRWCDY